MQSDDPSFLPVGTEVSAKFKGAFCEAKIKKVNRTVKYKVAIKEPPYGYAMVEESHIRGAGPFQQNQDVEVLHASKYQKAIVQFVKDASVYHVVFDDGDERTLKRTQVCLKGAKHYNEAHNLDALPLYNPEQFGSPVVAKVVGKEKKRVSRSSLNGSAQKVRPEQEESSDDETSASRARSSAPKRRQPEKDDESEEEETPKPKVKRRAKRAAANAARDNFVEHDDTGTTEDEETNSDEELHESGGEAADDPRSSKKEKEIEKDEKRKDERKKDKEDDKRVVSLKPGTIVCAYDAPNKTGKFFPAIVVSSKVYRVQKGVKPLRPDHVPMRSFMNGRYMSSAPVLVHPIPSKIPKNVDSTALKQALSKAKEYTENKILPNGWSLKDDILGESTKKKKKEEVVESSSDSSATEQSSSEEDEEYANARDVFVAHFYKFQEENATPINKQPVLGGKIIDLYRFYHVVQRMGGHRKVTHGHKWKKVMIRMKLGGCAGATPVTVKNAYQKYLVSFSQAYTRLGWSLSELTTHTSEGRRNTRMIRSSEQDILKEKGLKRKLSVDKEKERERKKEKKEIIKEESRESTEKPAEKPEKIKPKEEKDKEKKDDNEKKGEKDKEKRDEKEKEKEHKKKKIEEEVKEKRDDERKIEKERRREDKEKEEKDKKSKRERITPSPARSTASSSTKEKERDEKEREKKREKKEKLREEEKDKQKKHKEEQADKEKLSLEKPKEKDEKDETKRKEKVGSERCKEKDPREFKRERSAAKELVKKERKRTDSLSTTSEDETRKRREKRKSFSVPGGKEKSVEKFDGPDTSGKQQLNDLDEGYVQPHVLHHFKQGQNVRALHLGRWYNARVIQTYNSSLDQLATLLNQKEGEPAELSGARLEAVRKHMSATKCFVHYLGWNSRYDENILLHKVRVTIKDEEDSRLKIVRQIGDRITPARVEWLLNWSKSPDGIDSLRNKETEEKPTLLTAIGPYRPRRISMTQLEQISERAERAEEEKRITHNLMTSGSPLKNDRSSSVIHGHSRSPSKTLESVSSSSTLRGKSPSKEASPVKDRREDLASRTCSLQPRRVRTPNKEFPPQKVKSTETFLSTSIKKEHVKQRFDKEGSITAGSTVLVRDNALEVASAKFKALKSREEEERERRKKEEKRKEEERKKKEEEERVRKEKEREAERLKLKEKEEKEKREREERIKKEKEREEKLKKEEEKKRREEEERKKKREEEEKRRKRKEDEKRRKDEEEENERKRREEEEAEKRRKEEEDRKQREEEERCKKEKLEKKRLEDEEREQKKIEKMEMERREKERIKKEDEEKARKLIEQIRKDAEKAELATRLQLEKEKRSSEKESFEGPPSKRGRREQQQDDEETDRLLEEAKAVCAPLDDSDVAPSGSETPQQDEGEVDDTDKWSVSDSQSIVGGPMTSPSRGFRGKRKRVLPRPLLKKKKDDENDEESEEEEVENAHKETFNSLRKHMWKIMEADGAIDNYEYLGLEKLEWNYEHLPETAVEAESIKSFVLDRMETLRQIYYEERAGVQSTMKRLTKKREKEREARELSQVKSPDKIAVVPTPSSTPAQCT